MSAPLPRILTLKIVLAVLIILATLPASRAQGQPEASKPANTPPAQGPAAGQNPKPPQGPAPGGGIAPQNAPPAQNVAPLAGPQPAQNPPPPAATPEATVPPDVNVPISISPEILQPLNGKLPAQVPFAVFEKHCAQPDSTLSLTKYSVQIMGAGLTLDSLHSSDCSIKGTLTVDPNTPPATYQVVLVETATGNPHGNAGLTVLDTGAGPIPPGLPPQVDVMWEVLTQNVCNDVFGKRVARNFYCIEIKLGNNTGHPLQIAGIGFSRRLDELPKSQTVILANTSYASTRAVLLREEVLSPRNELYHTVQATGLLMTAFIPFFHAPGPSRNFATAASIVSGPLLQAIDVIAPDRVVGQLNNLDDQTFRDNQVIPNNAHMRTLVFVEKRALTEILASYCGTPQGNDAQLACQASEEKPDQTKAFRAQLAQEAPNSTKNSTQKDKRWFWPTPTGDHSPLLVKLALGDLVVIGELIEYLQRVQLQTSATQAATPTLTLSVDSLDFGSQTLRAASPAKTVTVTNSSAAPVSGIVVGVTGVNHDEFVQTENCSPTIAAGANCTVSVTFTPGQPGARTATLSIAYSGSGSPRAVKLAGSGTNAQ